MKEIIDNRDYKLLLPKAKKDEKKIRETKKDVEMSLVLSYVVSSLVLFLVSQPKNKFLNSELHSRSIIC